MTYLGKPNNPDEVLEWDGTKFITASIIVSASEFNEWTDGGNRMVATSSISIHSTGLYANQLGSNIFFYVSGVKNTTGASASGYSVFGGDVVISGAAAVGTTHVITGSASSFIGGGVTNTISASSQNAIIGGNLNTVNTTATNATIIGGLSNTISASQRATIIGGTTNIIYNTSTNSTIIGGGNHFISSTLNAGILGGSGNEVNDSSSEAVIIGGFAHKVSRSTDSGMFAGSTSGITGSSQAIILGGQLHNISGTTRGTILGGTTNTILEGSTNSVIVGGTTSTVSSASTAAGIFVGSSHVLKNVSSNSGIFAGFNHIISGSLRAAILGGSVCLIDNTNYGIIGGGLTQILSASDAGAIIGGNTNTIKDSSNNSAIIAGASHNISGSVRTAIIAGASHNISKTATNSVIVGGSTNAISSSINSVIIGGSTNLISPSANNSILLGTALTASVANSIILGGSGYQTIISGGLTGSLQKTSAGNSYIIGGNNITVNTNSLGQIEITGSVGAGNWVEGSPSPRLRTSASLSISSNALFAQNYGTNIFFYVSGSKFDNTKDSVFGGDVVISGNLISGVTASIYASSLYSTILGSQNSFISASNYSSLFGVSDNSSIGGGNSDYSTVLGSRQSFIYQSKFTFIAASDTSNITATSVAEGAPTERGYNATIGGGSNAIADATYAHLYNSIYSQIQGQPTADTSVLSTIVGSLGSQINNSEWSSIVGGYGNIITNSHTSMIIGLQPGQVNGNTIQGVSSSLIIGDNITCNTSNTIIIGNSSYQTIVSGGLTGSLQKTIDGNAYIKAGPGITVITNSLQQIEISCSAITHQYIGMYDSSTVTSSNAKTVGSTYFDPTENNSVTWKLRTILATTIGSNTAIVKLYNVTSGAYVHIGGAGITTLSTSNTTPTKIDSVNLYGATNFYTSSVAIYELQYYGNGSSPITIHYGSELIRS
jgi:hypothetical protein